MIKILKVRTKYPMLKLKFTSKEGFLKISSAWCLEPKKYSYKKSMKCSYFSANSVLISA